MLQIEKKLLQNLEKILVKKRKIALAEREKQNRITKVKNTGFKSGLITPFKRTIITVPQTCLPNLLIYKVNIKACYR